jgi:hypothetical protein
MAIHKNPVNKTVLFCLEFFPAFNNPVCRRTPPEQMLRIFRTCKEAAKWARLPVHLTGLKHQQAILSIGLKVYAPH